MHVVAAPSRRLSWRRLASTREGKMPALRGLARRTLESDAATRYTTIAMTASPAARRAPDLTVTLAGIEFKNPVIAASGTFGYGIEFEDVVHLDKIGGFVVKGLSREPMAGNPPPRLYETAAGMLNAIGLQNIGARAFVDEKLPKLREIKNTVVIANVFGYTREDYELTIEILNEGEGIAAYELNVSCPNTAAGGMQFGSDPRSLDEVVATARHYTKRPLIVKLSPNVTSIAQMAYVAQEAGADAVSLVNTFVAMAIDSETRKPRIANVTAGLSGPAIKPIALRMVYDAAKAVKIPVIGMGGISTATDIIEFMLAGATAVQIGTASYWDPCATEKIVDELQDWCVEHRVERLASLTGGLVLE
jgi:dihydroorotate dehydrogenase (NAD+) catalytic subunit